jgi:ribosomal protein L9
MTKYVAGTGSAGEVVQVTPAFFNNKLRPTQSAVVITDEEVASEQSEKIKERLEQDDYKLVIQKKAGPDGQLFGGISPKVILTELQKNMNDEYLDQKQVKVAGITQDGKKFRGDIKHVGDYSASLSLTKEISANFPVSVQGES